MRYVRMMHSTRTIGLLILSAGLLHGQEIAAGKTIERSLAAGDSHSYQIQAKGGDVV